MPTTESTGQPEMPIDERFWDAMEPEDIDEVSALIQRALADGADPNAPCDEVAHTALYWAAFSGRADCVRLLLEAGARPNAESSTEQTSLHAAAENNDLPILDMLLASESDQLLDRFDYVFRTPLIVAAELGHNAIARALIDAGADVNANDEEMVGDTPLRAAAFEGHVEMVEILLNHGADPTITGWMGLSAAHKAQLRNDRKGRKMLALMKQATSLSKKEWKSHLLPWWRSLTHEYF